MVPVTISQLAIKLVVQRLPAPAVPALVWEGAPSMGSEAGDWEMTGAGEAFGRPRGGEPMVFFVEKGASTNNPFAMGVTVGRVENNDVVVDDASVSRFHAWLQLDERAGKWSLTDAESKNGTWLDGVQLEAKQRVLLNDGSRLKFGDVQMAFLLPPALRHLVEARYQAQASKR